MVGGGDTKQTLQEEDPVRKHRKMLKCTRGQSIKSVSVLSDFEFQLNYHEGLIIRMMFLFRVRPCLLSASDFVSLLTKRPSSLLMMLVCHHT